MKKREQRQRLVRILAIVLVVLLVGTTVLSVLVSVFAEETTPARDSYERVMDYMEDE